MDRAEFPIYLTEKQWQEMLTMVQQEVKRSEGIINKCINHPSFTISSQETMDKHRSRIQELNEIIDTIRETL